jgi:hypothetical protein
VDNAPVSPFHSVLGLGDKVGWGLPLLPLLAVFGLLFLLFLWVFTRPGRQLRANVAGAIAQDSQRALALAAGGAALVAGLLVLLTTI